MVVVSNATFVQDNAITQDQQALDFVSASVNWLMNREQLIGIAPKIPKTLTFTLDEKALRNMRWLVLVFMPLIPAVHRLRSFGGNAAPNRLRFDEIQNDACSCLPLS